MKRLITAPLAALMLVGLASPAASAHRAPYPHYHSHYRGRAHHRRASYRVYIPRRRAVIYRPAPLVIAPPPPVYVAPPPAVYVAPPAPPVVVRSRPRVVRRPSLDDFRIGLGLHATGSILGGDKIGIDSAENSPLAGAGLSLKLRMDRHWALEISADALTATKADFTQTTVPLMASALYYFRPASALQPYVTAGIGLHQTSLAYLDGRYKYDISELAGQLGGGVEFFLTRWLSLHADARLQTVLKDMDTQAKIRDDCLASSGSKTGFCDGIHAADPNDKLNVGVLLQAGASIYF